MTRVRDAVFGVLLFLAAGAPAQTAQIAQANQKDELSKKEAEKLTLDAVALYRSGDTARALTNLERALAFYRRTGDRHGQEEVLYARGVILAEKGDRAKALDSFAESLTILREIGGEGEATVLHDKAFVHLDLRQYEEAIAAFEQERAAHTRTGNRKDEGEALHNLGFVHAAQGHNEQALEFLGEALAIRREVGDRDGEARTLGITALLYQRLGQPQKALDVYQQTLAIWRALRRAEKVDQIESEIASLRASLGPVQKAPTEKQRAQSRQANDLNTECASARVLAKCERALALFREAGDRSGEGMALGNAGVILIERSDYARAKTLLAQALAIGRETRDEEAQGNALINLGLVSMAWAQYPQALTFFDRALAIQQKHYDLGGEARTIGNIAGIHVALGQFAEAAAMYERLLPQQGGQERASTLTNLGVIRRMKKEFPEALDLFQKAAAMHRALGSPLLRTSLANLGSVNGELGQNAKALELYQEALTLDRKVGDRMSESGSLGAIAEIQARQGEPAKALDSYQQALAIARDVGSPTAESSWLAGIGRVLESQGKFQAALDAYQQSIAVEEAIRSTGQTEEIKTGLAEGSSEIYQRAARLLVVLGRPVEAFNIAERARARTFLDQLGNTRVEIRQSGASKDIEQERILRLALAGLNRLLMQERARPRAEQDMQRIRSLSDQLTDKRREYAEILMRLKSSSPEYASLVSVSPLKLAEVQRLLEPDTSLVAYLVTPDETLAFVVTRDAFQALELPVSEKDLAAAVGELRGFANLGGPPPPSLARLSAWLVTPLRPLLKTPLVGIVPHGVLHLLPFAALGAGDGKKYFGEDYTLFHLPTASVLPFIQQKRKAIQGNLLAIGQGHAEGLPPLRYAEKEAAAVAALYGTTALVGAAATETALRERAGSVGILHIAAHGQLNSVTPIFSRIVLAPDDTLDTERDGSLDVREIYELELKRTSLVVLSACQTQLGAQSRGDDFVGLSRAFIYAGSPAVVASLWSVDDTATASLMTAFHRNLRRGLGHAAALRAAQAETRAEHPDPYYWASFVLTGDPK